MVDTKARSLIPLRAAWLPLLALTLTACQPDRDPDGDDEPPEPVAGAEQRDTQAPADNTDDAAQTDDTSDEADTPGSDGGSAQETAIEYRARQESETQPAAADAAAKAPACAACHGVDGGGNTALHTPRIGGMEAWYLARQLKYFKQGIRGGTDEDVYGRYMHGMALLLEDDAEIERLAAHFADLDPRPVPAELDGDVERGRELYTGCASCHGEDGSGSAELNTPSLVGQSGPYIVRQLENYRTGLRGADPDDVFGMQMLPLVESSLESRQDSVDVAAYIETLTGADAPDSGAQAPAEPTGNERSGNERAGAEASGTDNGTSVSDTDDGASDDEPAPAP